MRNPFLYPGFRVLLLFSKDPYREFYLREVAKRARVSSSTAKRFLDFYVEGGLLEKQKKANLALFKANVENLTFRHIKIGYFLMGLSSLVSNLREVYPNASIILYGSCARGEDEPHSDIDLLIISGRKERMEFSVFEKHLGRKINTLVFEPYEWEEKAKKDRAFYERILIDGIPLQGSLPVVKM
jgi:predicted nucleotidyltransferase